MIDEWRWIVAKVLERMNERRGRLGWSSKSRSETGDDALEENSTIHIFLFLCT